jgi:hypothetical protein
MNDDDEMFRVEVDMDESKPRVREATDVVLRSTVVDPSLVFDEMGRGVREVLDGLDTGVVPDEFLAELVNRLAHYWGAWVFVGKAGAIFGERAGLDHVAFGQFVEEMVDGWVADDD